MTQLYQSKAQWYTQSPVRICPICGSEFTYRPLPLAVAESPDGDGYTARKAFPCCWPCDRSLADMLPPSDEMERIMTDVMLEFKSHYDENENDDPDGYAFLQHYSRFSQIPPAPMPDQFARCGGDLTPEGYRKWWTQLSGTHVDHVKSPVAQFDHTPGFCFHADVPDQYNATASRYNGVSTRRCGGLRMGPGGWGGSRR